MTSQPSQQYDLWVCEILMAQSDGEKVDKPADLEIPCSILRQTQINTWNDRGFNWQRCSVVATQRTVNIPI